MGELGRRIITAAIGGTIFLAAIFWQAWSMTFAFGVIALFSLWEFYSIHQDSTGSTRSGLFARTAAAFLFFLLPALFALGHLEFYMLVFLIPLIGLAFIKELFRGHEQPFNNIGIDILAVLYISMPMAMLVYIGNKLGFATSDVERDFNSWTVCGILVLIWANDIGAYFAGRALGKRPLFKRISPKKSWEGFFGGMLASVAVALLWVYFDQSTTANPADTETIGALRAIWVGIALICSTVGPMGDLVASMLKRSKGIKDSGTLLPGHGGFLDRFDALFIAVPFIFTLLLVLSKISEVAQ